MLMKRANIQFNKIRAEKRNIKRYAEEFRES